MTATDVPALYDACCEVKATVFSFQVMSIRQSTGVSVSTQVMLVVEVGKNVAKLQPKS